ncbi:MAG TPA: hypothetical protein VKW06_11385 [Candidatus Angelobacter sp.]|nr:hypothetical protein [Candidatus Angelobacter sp.]
MKSARRILTVLLLLSAVVYARKRDPLTEAEADELRQVAQEPYKRLKLLIKFAEARLTSVDEVRADPKEAAGRGKKIHDLLEDFTALIDEMNDNLDVYQGRPLTKDDRKDFHKGLKEVIAAEERFELKLKDLKSPMASDPKTRVESQDYRFVIQDAEDALKSSLDMAREYDSTGNEPDSPKKK